ncbi:hypothetical protein D9M68_548950 [compost metagenome]
MLQVQARLLQLGLGGEEAGVLLDGQRSAAAEVLGDALEVMLAGVDLLGGQLGGLAGFVEAGRREVTLLRQVGLALQVLFGEGVAGTRKGQFGGFFLVAGLQRGEVAAHLGLARLGLGDGDAEAGGIDAEQHLAGGHLVVLLRQHLGDGTGHIRADRHLVGLGVGIVGFHVAAAVEKGDQTGDDQQHWHGDHQQQALEAQAGGCRRILFRGDDRMGVHGAVPWGINGKRGSRASCAGHWPTRSLRFR